MHNTVTRYAIPRVWPRWKKSSGGSVTLNLWGEECCEADDAFHYHPHRQTLADELRCLRTFMKKRDQDPFAGWHPCSGDRCECNPAYKAFRQPSKEMLAMQAGKPAYGRGN